MTRSGGAGVAAILGRPVKADRPSPSVLSVRRPVSHPPDSRILEKPCMIRISSRGGLAHVLPFLKVRVIGRTNVLEVPRPGG